MSIVVSGLPREVCERWLGMEGDGVQAVWCAPETFLEALGSAETTDDAQVWLYVAPWGRVGELAEQEIELREQLARWLAAQRKLLRLRRSAARPIVLVNAERVTGSQVLAMLGVAGVDATGADADPVAAGTNPDPALAKLFEWAAPQYWDAFEALEAASWLPCGEPIFRHGVEAPGEDALFRLLESQRSAAGLPGALEELARLNEQIAASAAELARVEQVRAELQREVESLTAAREDVAQENELLVLQLHQVQEELERVYLEAKEAGARFEAEKAELARKVEALGAEQKKAAAALEALSRDKDKLAAELDKERKALVELKRQAASQQASGQEELAQENELLLLQLHQVQEELEAYYLANRDLTAELDRLKGGVTASGANSSGAVETPTAVEVGRPGNGASGKAELEGNDGKNRRGGFRLLLGPAKKLLKRSKATRKLRDQVSIIEGSGLFDREWYLNTYPDVRAAGMDPIEHYLRFGWKESRNPCNGFDTAYYLRANPDVARSGLNPLLHYVKFGRDEGRDPV